RPRLNGKRKLEYRAAFGAIFRPDAPPVEAHNGFAERETQSHAGTLPFRRHAVELVENLPLLSRSDPGTPIRHLNPHRPFLDCRRDLNGGAGHRVVKGVIEEI